MKPWILCLFFALAASPAFAQRTYAEAMQQGDAALRRGAYKIAIDKYFAAEAFDPAQKETVRAKVNVVFEKIEALRKEAEDAKKRADEALRNLQRIANQAVPIVLADIDRDIYRLDYDSTYEKCRTAVGLNARRPEVEKRIWEIAYFYTEADTAAAAVAFLNLLRPTGLTAETPGLQDKLRTYLAVTLPSYYMDTLQERYYPKTLLVEGGGAFWQEELEDTLRVEKPFRICETEITYWQYNVFARAEKHHIEPPAWEYAGDNPVVYVSWYDAAFYCNWLSKRHEKETVYTLTNPSQGIWSLDFDVEIDTAAKGYRLPTEAEWEFAARGGNHSMGYEYSGDSVLTDVAWYAENSNNRTRAVKLKKRNELGLYDMSGNVWEWCQDWYFEGTRRVLRGGSWNLTAVHCRTAYRTSHNPVSRYSGIGFRLVFVPQ
jgi:sulfatase modifying factor 1